MIGTNEPPCPAGWGVADLRAAMPADIPQGVDLAVVAANDDQRIVTDGKSDVVVRLPNFTRMADK